MQELAIPEWNCKDEEKANIQNTRITSHAGILVILVLLLNKYI
jgi:hypothetical protein